MVARPGFRSVWPNACRCRAAYARAREDELFALVTGFVQSQILFAALKSGLIDAVADGPVGRSLSSRRRTGFSEDRLRPPLAGGAIDPACSASARTALSRWAIMAPSSAGMTGAAGDDQTSCASVPRSQSDPVALFDGSYTDTEMRRLWSYAGRAAKPRSSPADAAAYSALMAASQSMLSGEILDAYDFGQHTSLIDVGGGEGVILSQPWPKRYPGLRLSLFDLPPVAEPRPRIRFLQSQPLGQCPRCHGGSFLDDPLPRGHDCVTLVRVLFDHEDTVVLRLLRNVRAAMEPGQTPGDCRADGRRHGSRKGNGYSTAYFGVYVMAMGSGRCRTPEEIGALDRAGRVSPVSTSRCAARR
jgi:demethylspheroidene O-methyltransferase